MNHKKIAKEILSSKDKFYACVVFEAAFTSKESAEAFSKKFIEEEKIKALPFFALQMK